MMSPAGGSKPHQILVVEDLDYEFMAITAAIEEVVPKCSFVSARDIREAESIIRKHGGQFDLIVLDLKFGEGSEGGLALLEPDRVWHQYQIPIIVYTAVTNVEVPRATYEVGIKVCVRKLSALSTQELQMAVTGILQEELRIDSPSVRLVDRVDLASEKQLEEALEKAVKPLHERIKSMWAEQDELIQPRDIARVLVECASALEVILMLASTGPATSKQLVDEVIGEENLLETIAELRRCDMIVVEGMEVSITEKGRRVVDRLRQWRKERM